MPGTAELASNTITWITVSGWIFSSISLLGGWLLTVYGWKIRYRQSLKLLEKKELNSAIETALEELKELESQVIDYWLNKETNLLPDQIIISAKRLTTALKQVKNLDTSRAFPADLMAKTRRYSTLDIETKKNCIENNRSQVAMFLKVSQTLRESEYLHKS